MNKKLNLDFILAVVILIIIVLTGIFAPLLAPYNPFQPDMLNRLQTPNCSHWFGTDALGRDMFSRILYGSRYSILLSLISTIVSLVIGTMAGVLAGFYGKKLDFIITLLSNIFQSIPGSCFMIAIAGMFGPSITTLVIALVITSWAGFSRITRAEVLKIKGEPFMEGLVCIGCKDRTLIFKHILPNIFDSLVVLASLRMGRGVLAIAGLSFLGLGVQPPIPDWSVMVNDAIIYYRSYPHLVVVPGMCIFALVYSINTIGGYLKNNNEMIANEAREWD